MCVCVYIGKCVCWSMYVCGGGVWFGECVRVREGFV